MPVIVDKNGHLYEPYVYETEKEFERDVVANASHIFGVPSLYIDVKRRMAGNSIVTIPDGYVLDVTNVTSPKLFVVENEIVSHDPFRHIGVQMLKFVTSFEEAQKSIKDYLMVELSRLPVNIAWLERAAKAAGSRNVDSYLETAVYSEFKGLVVIDEARPELHQVLKRINANISVLEFRKFVAPTGDALFEFDTLYDEPDIDATEVSTARASPERREERRMRRAGVGSPVKLTVDNWTLGAVVASA